MRKIKFDDKQIEDIKNYIECGHTKRETCNRFNIKLDTLSRVMREHNISPYYKSKINSNKVEISEETVSQICQMYMNTDIRMEDLCKEFKLKNYVVQSILNENFTQEYRDKRKSRIYRKSKLGKNNPMYNKCGELHPNYKGIVEDGNGYYIVLKPDWYTGRKNSKHVFYHSVVFCEHIGIKEIPKGYVVHHIDGDKKNNNIDNLALMTISGHAKLHTIMRNLCKVQRLSEDGVD